MPEGTYAAKPVCFRCLWHLVRRGPGFDVAGAARFGITTVWLNRAGAPIDRLPHGLAPIVPDVSRPRDFL